MKEKCKHIYGYDEGFDIGGEEETLPTLVDHKSHLIDVVFNYCQLCGEKL